MSKHIQVEHPNGYYGELYGKSSLAIFKGTQEVFHTGSRSIESAEELYEVLERFPTFIKVLQRLEELEEGNENENE